MKAVTDITYMPYSGILTVGVYIPALITVLSLLIIVHMKNIMNKHETTNHEILDTYNFNLAINLINE